MSRCSPAPPAALQCLWALAPLKPPTALAEPYPLFGDGHHLGALPPHVLSARQKRSAAPDRLAPRRKRRGYKSFIHAPYHGDAGNALLHISLSHTHERIHIYDTTPFGHISRVCLTISCLLVDTEHMGHGRKESQWKWSSCCRRPTAARIMGHGVQSKATRCWERHKASGGREGIVR